MSRHYLHTATAALILFIAAPLFLVAHAQPALAAGVALSTAQSNDVLTNWPALRAIDGNVATAYSSKSFPTIENTRNTHLAAYASSVVPVNQVILTARMVSGRPFGFPLVYTIQVTNPTNSAWVKVGEYSIQPDSSGVVTINLPRTYMTLGVMVIPKELGTDDRGTYYFQLAEVALGNVSSGSQCSDTSCATGTYAQSTSQIFIVSNAQALGFEYAYGASIIYTQGKYHAYFCSKNPTGWDQIRHETSPDLINWSAPDSLLTPTDRERANCDPSVVLYNAGDGPYYYMFYGANISNIQGVIFVARSKSPDGPFLKYTNRGTWEANPADPHVIAWPFKAAANGSGIYGAGQPTVVLKDGVMYMWYTDSDQSGQPDGIYFRTSKNAINWSSPIYTNVDDRSVDVKYDPVSGKFLMTEVTPPLSPSSELLMRTSTDGISWSAPQTICDQNCFPHNASNVGVSGDDKGHLLPGKTLISFGAPYNLNASAEAWGKWNLFGELFNISL
jgi:hypothetical protein